MEKKPVVTALRLLVLFCLAAAAGGAEPSGASPEGAAPRNFLLVSIDTLRADHLSAYGYPWETSSNFDALAREGVLFERAYCQIPVTGPSHATLLTGLQPQTHGAYRNGVRMNDSAISLAQILQDSGYRTAAFLSAWTMRSKLTGLDRGFDTYDEDMTDSYGMVNSQRPANETCNRAIAWLGAQDGEEPFFLFLHLFDPHEPYDLKGGFEDLEVSGEKPPARPGEIVRYDSEIAFADTHMARVIRAVEKRGWLDETLIVVVADHGEAFGEHGYNGHGRRVHEPGIHVPLLFHYPRGLARDRRVEQLAGLIDLAPTVLELMGAKALGAHQGKSLAPWLAPGEAPPPAARQIHSVSYPGTVGHMPGWVRRIFSRKKPNRPMQMALLWDDWKYVLRPQKGKAYLYDLAKDPGETRDLLADYPEHLPVRVRLEDWFELTRDEEGETVLTAEDRQRLESLGYTGGAGGASRAGSGD